MKKRILLITLLLAFCLTGCGGTGSKLTQEDVVGHGAEDYLGSYTENTYKNERYSIHFTSPSRDFEFAILDEILTGDDWEVVWFPAYGPHTRPESWFEDPTGRDVVLSELRKTALLRKTCGVVCSPQ